MSKARFRFGLTDLPIQWKLASLICVLVGVLLILLAANTFALRAATSAQHDAELVTELVNEAHVTVRTLSRRQISLIRMVFDGTDASLQAFEKADADVTAALAGLGERVARDEVLERYSQTAATLNAQWVRANAQALLQVGERMRSGRASADERDAALAAFLIAETQDAGSRRISAELDGLIKVADARLTSAQDELEARAFRLELVNAFALLLVAVSGGRRLLHGQPLHRAAAGRAVRADGTAGRP